VVRLWGKTDQRTWQATSIAAVGRPAWHRCCKNNAACKRIIRGHALPARRHTSGSAPARHSPSKTASSPFTSALASSRPASATWRTKISRFYVTTIILCSLALCCVEKFGTLHIRTCMPMLLFSFATIRLFKKILVCVLPGSCSRSHVCPTFFHGEMTCCLRVLLLSSFTDEQQGPAPSHCVPPGAP
jgi:hypothetical protein